MFGDTPQIEAKGAFFPKSLRIPPAYGKGSVRKLCDRGLV